MVGFLQDRGIYIYTGPGRFSAWLGLAVRPAGAGSTAEAKDPVFELIWPNQFKYGVFGPPPSGPGGPQIRTVEINIKTAYHMIMSGTMWSITI